MKFFLDSAKAFLLPFETYYAEGAIKPYEKYPYITIGFYNEQGTEGEFNIVWNDLGIRLQAYDDSWEALSKMPELIELMALIDKNKLNPTIEEFAEMLRERGYRDITRRERPKC